MAATGRPGPKPKRIYARWVSSPEPPGTRPPNGWAMGRFVRELDRVGRLVASGQTTDPVGDLLLFRAVDRREAARVLRSDPWREVARERHVVIEWDPRSWGGGVNLEPAPARGSGRLTALDRVAVVVREQTSARRWYEGVLGLRVRDADVDTGYLELSFGRGAVGICLVAPRRDWGEPYYSETAARIGQATGIVFETDSIPALELRLRKAGARITEAAKPQPWGGETLRFCDPDGNEFLAFQEGGRARTPLPRTPVDRRSEEPRHASRPGSRPKSHKRTDSPAPEATR